MIEKFKKFIKRQFKIELDFPLINQKGVRICNREVFNSKIRGWKGYSISDRGFNVTTAFVQNFGHLAKRNKIELNPEEARRFVAGEDLEINLGKKPKHIIVIYKGYGLGAAYYDGNKIVNKLPKKRRRNILNDF